MPVVSLLNPKLYRALVRLYLNSTLRINYLDLTLTLRTDYSNLTLILRIDYFDLILTRSSCDPNLTLT